MFKENKKSAQNKTRNSQTARSNSSRREMSTIYKLTINNEPISSRKMSISTTSKMNLDQNTEKDKSKLLSNTTKKLEPSVVKIAVGVEEPPLPDEWWKTPQQVYKTDEYKVFEDERELHTERLK